MGEALGPGGTAPNWKGKKERWAEQGGTTYQNLRSYKADSPDSASAVLHAPLPAASAE